MGHGPYLCNQLSYKAMARNPNKRDRRIADPASLAGPRTPVGVLFGAVEFSDDEQLAVGFSIHVPYEPEIAGAPQFATELSFPGGLILSTAGWFIQDNLDFEWHPAIAVETGENSRLQVIAVNPSIEANINRVLFLGNPTGLAAVTGIDLAPTVYDL